MRQFGLGFQNCLESRLTSSSISKYSFGMFMVFIVVNYPGVLILATVFPGSQLWVIRSGFLASMVTLSALIFLVCINH